MKNLQPFHKAGKRRQPSGWLWLQAFTEPKTMAHNPSHPLGWMEFTRFHTFMRLQKLAGPLY